jgi:hypothetical protein
MADPSLLASILSGQDPLAAQMVPGYLAAQQAQAAINPEYGHNEGIAGALAKTLAGIGGAGMQPAVQNVVNQRVAAQPQLAQLLASNDPYKKLAEGGPGQYGPVASAALLNASPEQVANTRLLNASAGLGGLNLSGYEGLNQLRQAGQPPPTGPMRGPGAGAVTGNPGMLGTGRYPQGGAPSGGGAPDPLAALPNMTPQQRQAFFQDPRMRALALQRYRALQQHLSTVNQAGGDASRPPT